MRAWTQASETDVRLTIDLESKETSEYIYASSLMTSGWIMSDELEAVIASAVDVLRTEGFEHDYIDVAVSAYRENLQDVRKGVAEHDMRLAASPLYKVTSVSSVDDPHPKESIGWQYRVLQQGEPTPGGWVIVDD
jgi:collagenase-like PrtC family protease